MTITDIRNETDNRPKHRPSYTTQPKPDPLGSALPQSYKRDGGRCCATCGHCLLCAHQDYTEYACVFDSKPPGPRPDFCHDSDATVDAWDAWEIPHSCHGQGVCDNWEKRDAVKQSAE